MAKEKKKGIGGIITAILVPIILIVFVVASFFAIIDGIIQAIIDLIGKIIDALLTLLTDPAQFFKELWEAINKTIAYINNWWNENVYASGEFNPYSYEKDRIDPVTIIDLSTFNEMKTALDTIISRNTAGLDDATLKKMLLAYYRGLFLDDTSILIELSHEDFELTESQFEDFQKGRDLIKDIAELEEELKKANTLNKIKIKRNINNKKSELKKLSLTQSEINANEQKINPFAIIEGNEDKGIGKDGKIYLQTKGMVQVYSDLDYNDDGKKDKILYYHPDTLYKIYDEHYTKMLKKGTPGATDYANSVKEYLGKCYTYTENGLKMYTAKTIEETQKTWEYLNETTAANEPENLGEWFANAFGTKDYEERERRLTPTTIYPVKEQILEFSNKVSEYSTPVEFMIYLLEITGSKEFVNAFIETAGNDNYIRLQLYELINIDVEYSIEEKERTTTITGNRNNKYTVEVIQKKEKLELNPLTWGNVFWQDVNTSDFTEQEGIVAVWAGTDEHETYLPVTINGTIKKGEMYKIALYYNGQKVDEIDTDRMETDSSSFTVYFYDLLLDDDVKTDTSKVIETTTIQTSTEQYGIAISGIKTWYGNFTPNNIVIKTITMDNLQGTEKNNSRKQIRNIQNAQNFDFNELFAELAQANENLQSIDISAKSNTWYSWIDTNVFNVKTLEEIGNTYEKNAEKEKKGIFVGYTEEECLNVQFNYVRELGQGDVNLSEYTFTNMNSVDTGRKKLTVYATYNEVLSEGIEEGRVNLIENYDAFLGLLSNKYGYYKLGESYKPVTNALNSGKLVEYNNIYGGKSKVVELLVNGSDMLFELLASSERTDGLENIMRYILYKYSNNDYGVTEWSFEIFKKEDMIDINSGSGSSGGGINASKPNGSNTQIQLK